jgi:hypothetical protein
MASEDVAAQERTESSTAPPKRVLPARERRESAAKRQASSPISTPKSVSTQKKSTPGRPPKTNPTKYNKRTIVPELAPSRHPSTPTAEDCLPTKVTDSRPLPTSYQPQSSKLSVNEYQTIAESAVLAASLHRSRMKWLAEGIFEKYWIKPSKKKSAESLANNPELKTMQRLGSSSILVGPHSFEATIYTVRDNLPRRHPNQYPQHAVTTQSGFQNYIPGGSQNATLQARPPTNQRAQMPPAEANQEKQRNQEKQEPLEKTEKTTSGTTISPPTQISKVPGVSQPHAPASPVPQSTTTQTGPDPVIRLLATRAASNPDLKALMKVVASSKATQEQLKLFQSHIDELNVMIRQQQGLVTPPNSHNGPGDQKLPRLTQLDGPIDHIPSPSHPFVDEKSRPSPYPAQKPQPVPPPQSQPRPSGRIGPLGPPLTAPPYPHYPPPQQKMPVAEPRFKAIVLEFTTPASSATPASQDRYLFPEYAVLDTPMNGQGLEMICSFLVVRKGSDLLVMQPTEGNPARTPVGGLIRWKADEEYYQPVTMIIKTSQHRILETIARAAKPLSEVQSKMKEIMQSKTRVKDEWLVMRLPREKGMAPEGQGGRDRGFVDSAVEMEDGGEIGDEDDELKTFYGI